MISRITRGRLGETDVCPERSHTVTFQKPEGEMCAIFRFYILHAHTHTRN